MAHKSWTQNALRIVSLILPLACRFSSRSLSSSSSRFFSAASWISLAWAAFWVDSIVVSFKDNNYQPFEFQTNIEHLVDMFILACSFFFAFDIIFIFKIMFSTMTTFNSIFCILQFLFLSGFSFDLVLNLNNHPIQKCKPNVRTYEDI